ncbi:unnamed protein product [Cuscuta europaea]|uniref:Uncharacterized protein n=1 Tax=Cuscuta europaea TaxID=41803 RepID=A0A9P0ZKA1_CUSEU|nr:unnamed protein product [Cuscuta europaea]
MNKYKNDKIKRLQIMLIYIYKDKKTRKKKDEGERLSRSLLHVNTRSPFSSLQSHALIQPQKKHITSNSPNPRLFGSSSPSLPCLFSTHLNSPNRGITWSSTHMTKPP